MSVSCSIFLRERGNDGNNVNLRNYLTEWEFTLLRNQGCGALTFSAYASEAVWASTLEPYCAIDELVQVFFNMNGAAEDRTWMGTLEDIPDPSASPPARTHRRFRARPTWAQLENPGARALWVSENRSIHYIVDLLATYFAADQTTVVNSATEIIAGTSYDIVQAILEDTPIGPLIKKLAEINQATVYGVNGGNDKVYFKAETPASTAPAYTFRMGQHADGVVKFTRKQRRGSRANAFLVEGRDARSGNPMIVTAHDSALDSHADPVWRWKRLKAPELVSGPNIKRWAEWLVAKEKDPLEEGTLEIAGIDTFLTAGAIRDLNINVQIQDEDGVPIQYQGAYDQWPLQSITYRMTNDGSYNATLKMGNALPIDAMNELGVRELLQEIGVFGAKEFSNQIEVQADDDPWPITTYIVFLATNQMRNNVRIRLDNRITSIDLDATDPGDGSMLCLNLKSDYDGGVTGDGGGDTVGQFVTTAVGVGDSYDTFALMRRIAYPVLIEGQAGAGRDNHFFEPFKRSSPEPVTPVWHISNEAQYDGTNSIKQEHIIPNAQNPVYPYNEHSYDGFLLHNVPLTFQTNIVYEFWWGVPETEETEGRYLVFNYKDEDNYHYVQMWRGRSTVIRWRVGKVVDGVTTHSPLAVRQTYVGFGTVENLIRCTIELNPAVHTHKVTMANIQTGEENSISQTQAYNWWNPSDEMVYAGFRWTCPTIWGWTGNGDEVWRIKKMTFSGATGAAAWYLSRDDKETWEGPFNGTDSGTSVLLGAYAGGHTESADIYIKGYVVYPQILTGIAAGWKDA